MIDKKELGVYICKMMHWLVSFGYLSSNGNFLCVQWNIPLTDIKLTYIILRGTSGDGIFRIEDAEVTFDVEVVKSDKTLYWRTKQKDKLDIISKAYKSWDLLRDRRIREIEGFQF